MHTTPLIIEAAINGGTPKARNPQVPRSPEEIARDSLECLAAGAAIIHSHIEDYALHGQAAAERYMQGWKPVLERHPEAILCPTQLEPENIDERWAHNAILAEAGYSSMAVFDPGVTNGCNTGPDGLPGAVEFLYKNTYADIAYSAQQSERHGLGPSISIFEPGFLRTTLAYQRAGRLPAGALVKLYFGGDYNLMDGKKGGPSFGLQPTRKALDAYLEMLEGSGLPWCVALLGGDIAATELPRLAIERGGHVRVGLEDYAGEDLPSNRELVEQIVALATSIGRPVADSRTARALLGLPASPHRPRSQT